MNKNFEPIFEHLEEILELSSIETSAGVGIALANHVTDLLDYMTCLLKNPIKSVQDKVEDIEDDGWILFQGGVDRPSSNTKVDVELMSGDVITNRSARMLNWDLHHEDPHAIRRFRSTGFNQ